MTSGSPDIKRQKIEDDDNMKVEPAESSESKQTVQELMRMYYGKLFPHQAMYRWLAYGNDSKHPQADAGFFQKREFCFTLDGDIFVRYQSFKDGNDLKEALKARCPSKIDIGPVYSCNPQDRLKFGASFVPVERELVFDIDLTDYDEVRTCGKGGHICTSCWPLMAVAVQIIDRGLRADFGFQNILWVYSGRRGIHCWVCDPSARKLTDEQRSCVANYFAVYKGHENDKAKLALGAGGAALHPAVQEAVDMLMPNWEANILPKQRLLEDESMCQSVLKYVPDQELAKSVLEQWNAPLPTSLAKKMSGLDINVQRWRMLQNAVALKISEVKKQSALHKQLSRCLIEIVLAFSYPRLDMEVSKKMNHLLKAPFCVHPKTGKVCVPIDPQHAFDFDPEGVPTVHTLLKELEQIQDAVGDQSELWKKTAMAEFVKLFQEAFLDSCAAAGRSEVLTRSRTYASKPDFSF
ncbi:hypothetical protein CEUSTIGMA_g3078.t1 [Chlamydomonas eustigma]|uniref:DNA primase n=1 Tax=Chlamydomonas eustigma TaxID=1157962 RepID=A0A250WXS1_9CHLO|nr:hypothetical protein CEUSTIGMA_g3078.t1 [Chlamydomonas eustigma]|eukprot:GAX75634.1 hypothetical protein CEUSTIGMA_g3078.t1 [Chlamydomonas eustigma]